MRAPGYSIVTAKIPEDVYRELALRVIKGERSAFIRDAIVEKLQSVPRPDVLLNLSERVENLETQLSEVRSYLAKLELFTYEHGKVNPFTFCIDEIDHKIVEYLIHYKGATTPELGEHLKKNRWLVLNRLRRIVKLSKEQLGKSIIQYFAGEKMGKKRAWWVNEELLEV